RPSPRPRAAGCPAPSRRPASKASARPRAKGGRGPIAKTCLSDLSDLRSFRLRVTVGRHGDGCRSRARRHRRADAVTGETPAGGAGVMVGRFPKGGSGMKKLLVLSALAAMLASGTALADTSGKKIAFSNNYAGNSWRQAMLKSYDAVTKKAVADGVVAAADVFTTADQEVPTQA